MGDAEFTRCSNCKDEQQYLLGIGFLFSDVFNIIDHFPKGVKRKIFEITALYVIEDIDFSYQIFECKHCDTAHTRLGLSIEYDHGKLYMPRYKCSECKRTLKHCNRQLQTFKCRKCKQYQLKKMEVAFNWD